MRVASFNILNGRSLADGEVDAERLRDAAKLLDADVLGLQEV
ncbi:MAG TPA: endonuclease, partial [Mycobacteriales bacterium]|nr:endonuclease [Mycobacteriales bacterium]